jgi:hypothetical protein
METAHCAQKELPTNPPKKFPASIVAEGFVITRCDFVAYGQGMQKTLQRFFM